MQMLCNMSRSTSTPPTLKYTQWRPISAHTSCTSAQSDQSFQHTLNGYLMAHSFLKWPGGLLGRRCSCLAFSLPTDEIYSVEKLQLWCKLNTETETPDAFTYLYTQFCPKVWQLIVTWIQDITWGSFSFISLRFMYLLFTSAPLYLTLKAPITTIVVCFVFCRLL